MMPPTNTTSPMPATGFPMANFSPNYLSVLSRYLAADPYDSATRSTFMNGMMASGGSNPFAGIRSADQTQALLDKQKAIDDATQQAQAQHQQILKIAPDFDTRNAQEQSSIVSNLNSGKDPYQDISGQASNPLFEFLGNLGRSPIMRGANAVATGAGDTLADTGRILAQGGANLGADAGIFDKSVKSDPFHGLTNIAQDMNKTYNGQKAIGYSGTATQGLDDSALSNVLRGVADGTQMATDIGFNPLSYVPVEGMLSKAYQGAKLLPTAADAIATRIPGIGKFAQGIKDTTFGAARPGFDEAGAQFAGDTAGAATARPADFQVGPDGVATKPGDIPTGASKPFNYSKTQAGEAMSGGYLNPDSSGYSLLEQDALKGNLLDRGYPLLPDQAHVAGDALQSNLGAFKDNLLKQASDPALKGKYDLPIADLASPIDTMPNNVRDNVSKLINDTIGPGPDGTIPNQISPLQANQLRNAFRDAAKDARNGATPNTTLSNAYKGMQDHVDGLMNKSGISFTPAEQDIPGLLNGTGLENNQAAKDAMSKMSSLNDLNQEQRLAYFMKDAGQQGMVQAGDGLKTGGMDIPFVSKAADYLGSLFKGGPQVNLNAMAANAGKGGAKAAPGAFRSGARYGAGRATGSGLTTADNAISSVLNSRYMRPLASAADSLGNGNDGSQGQIDPALISDYMASQDPQGQNGDTNGRVNNPLSTIMLGNQQQRAKMYNQALAYFGGDASKAKTYVDMNVPLLKPFAGDQLRMQQAQEGLQELNDLEGLYSKAGGSGAGGAISSLVSGIPVIGSAVAPNMNVYNTQSKAIASSLGQALGDKNTGSKYNESRIQGMLPQPGDSANAAAQKMQILKNWINDRVKATTSVVPSQSFNSGL